MHTRQVFGFSAFSVVSGRTACDTARVTSFSMCPVLKVLKCEALCRNQFRVAAELPRLIPNTVRRLVVVYNPKLLSFGIREARGFGLRALCAGRDVKVDICPPP